MARQSTKSVPTAPVTTPVVPATPEPAPAADPFAGLVVYAPTAFVKAEAPVSPHVLAFASHLASTGSAVVITEGWAPEKIKAFRKALTSSAQCRAIVNGRRFLVRQGTATDGKAALSISLSKKPTNSDGNGAGA